MTARLGILLSGSGSTYANIVSQIEKKALKAEIAIVIASRPSAKALVKAQEWNHKTAVLSDQNEIQQSLEAHRCDLVAMCGFMRRYDPRGAS